MSNSAQSLAVLFVDICDSTRLFAEYGDERALTMTTECIAGMKSIVVRQGGTVVQTMGDGILCTFASVDDAFQAAHLIREAQSNSRLSIHGGLHYGPVIIKGDFIFGDAVNMAARMADLAKNEEIIL